MPLYHVSAAPLAADQTLQPGSWGRRLRQFRKGGQPLADVRDGFILAWETGLEIARRLVAPKAPSRLECVFTCATTADAAAFQARFRPNTAVYEVVPEPSDCPMFVGDYDLITGSGDDPFLDTLVDRSLLYWSSSSTQGIAEVLIGGNVRVLRPIQLGADSR
jgi:hypothetical protein